MEEPRRAHREREIEGRACYVGPVARETAASLIKLPRSGSKWSTLGREVGAKKRDQEVEKNHPPEFSCWMIGGNGEAVILFRDSLV